MRKKMAIFFFFGCFPVAEMKKKKKLCEKRKKKKKKCINETVGLLPKLRHDTMENCIVTLPCEGAVGWGACHDTIQIVS